MHITFISSSLEPGRDGVGDYTRMLAESAVRQGHDAQLIALNDRHMGASSYTGNGSLRLGAAMPWKDRIAEAKGAIAAFAPDWISVQFVAYGFHDRGFVWRLGDRLHRLAPSPATRFHLMFHELWIGDGGGASLRRRLEGRLQKHLVLGMVRRLAPSVVNAQATPYVAMLRQNGIAAERLPLFGNVPVSHTSDNQWLEEVFSRQGISLSPDRRQGLWLFGFFGTLHPEW